MKGLLWVLAGFLAGAAVAGLVTLFLAPRSGEATRGMIKEHIEYAVEQGQQAAEVRQRQLGHEFEALKQPQRA
ncbi:MAG TPA: YtxH domain-containing protein [Anaerolineae bacterium]|nr:YtxH domain-containing protein [Anaerolineae bacterium]